MAFCRSFILILLGATGCSEPMPPAADPDRAQAALQTALDAWRSGETPESLQSRSPVIYVSDSEWGSGKQLIDYKIESGKACGPGWRCDVLLTVKNGQGQTKKHSAFYRIDTDPAIVVVHEE